ncbi:sulfite exporter TauE/SafE family protein [Pseudahrensia aquimaris]|uniref:Probable membrane transporter protein n=1 Tax=Pseudahrensia aquimaris TaxID=744461 RepID=A0ABW3FGD6_9HYPH
MNIYLPIAEMSVNVFVLFGMGAGVGFLSGMFGVGGGFLMTPLLIFYQIPPAVAVATEANQIVASSFSGALAHLRRGSLDIKLGIMLLIGGVAGSMVGVVLFSALRSSGQLDFIISILYVGFLGTIGSLMVIESLNAIRKARMLPSDAAPAPRPPQQGWIANMPFKMRFERSQLYLSVIPVLGLGFLVGILASIMGVGGGFIMVPAMIYLLRVPTNVVIGTSLFQIMFVTMFTTIAQSATNQTVDVVLAFILMVGGVIGAQFGAQAGQKLKGEQLRALLGLIVLAVCIRLGWDLVATPSELFSIGTAVAH